MSNEHLFRGRVDRREFLTLGVGVFVALSMPRAMRNSSPPLTLLVSMMYPRSAPVNWITVSIT